MRPLSLMMQAFGPYAGRQELDFTCLADTPVFLIHGPTGAGKTTILDAMCFALYGISSGTEREGRQMRSDYADPSLPTEVTFDFSLGTACYRVHRSPEQERPRLRGDGMTTKKPEATLWRLEASDRQRAFKPKVMESQWSKVTARVEDLLGFRSDQFRQVIMLPQWQFQRLLMATSKEREAILEVLFQTEVYRRMEEALKEAARQLTLAMQNLRDRQSIILDQAQVGDAHELGERQGALRRMIQKGEQVLTTLRRKENRAGQRLDEAHRTEEAFLERLAAEEAVAGLLEQANDMESRTIELRLARKAASLRSTEEIWHERVDEAEERERELTGHRQELARAEDASRLAAKALAREKRKERSRQAGRKRLNQLEALAERIKELDLARVELKKARQEAAAIRGQHRQRRTDLKVLKRRLASLEKDLEEAHRQADQVEALSVKIKAARKELAQRERLQELSARYKDAKAGHREAGRSLKTAESEYQRSRRRLRTMEEAWNRGQAGVVASKLVPGEPCPVCGSRDHPHPAGLAGDVPPEASLLEQRGLVEVLEGQLARAQKTEAEAGTEMSRLEAEAASLKDGLTGVARVTPNRLRSTLQKLEQDLKAAQQAKSDAARMSGDLEKARVEEAKAIAELEKVEETLKKASNDLSEARAVFRERESRLPPALRTLPQLEAEIRRQEASLLRLEADLHRAEQEAEKAKERLAESRAARKASELAARSARQKARKAETNLTKRLRAAGFTGLQEFEKAKMDDARMETADREVKDYQADLKAARSRLSRARRLVRARRRPDLAKLEQQAREAKSRSDQKVADLAGLRSHLEYLTRWGADLAGINAELKELEGQYEVIGKVADVANGKNAEGITFQRFVLSSLLDDVLVAATDRLEVMSRGRFRLQRCAQRADRRIAGGLDLEVFDAHTGTTRAVPTLSGGEGFLASLSLAMGLADVVQAYAGGIYLETIFIDEGFGSLDPEALDLALRALIDLQKGKRLVGIISHVPELKERIDVRLEVSPTRRGSTARLVGADLS